MLVQDFYGVPSYRSLAPGQLVSLDIPTNDTAAFAEVIGPLAWQAQLHSELAQQAQAAMQSISTTLATNQIGSAPSGGGSTNLVTKPTTTDFLSIAAESGAFTNTVNGNAVTLQANALGIVKYLGNRPVFARWASGDADAIQPLTFIVSLDMAQGSSSAISTDGPATAATPTSISSVLLPTNNVSFSSFGVGYDLYRRHTPQEKGFQSKFLAAVKTDQSAVDAAGKSIATAVNALFLSNPDDLQTIITKVAPDLQQWHTAAATTEAQGASADAFAPFVFAYATYEQAFANQVLALRNGPANGVLLAQAVAAFSDVAYKVFNDARGTPLLTANYLYSSPADKPATHDFTLAFARLFKGGLPILDANGNDTGQTDDTPTAMTGVQLTANFTASIYASLPTGAQYGRLRDIQASLEFDKPIGKDPKSPRATFSLAGYGQYQYDPTVLTITAGNLAPGTNIPLPSNAQVLLGTSGWLGIVQAKLAVNLAQGFTLPIALKWSNKTDLIDANDVRGQIGLSYDLSALAKLISPGK
ncbi:MAG: hypothetical protein WCE63_04015 [Acidobacteriaceae bacterium]